VNDVFFAGSIRQKVVDRKSIFHIPNPKEVVRNDLALPEPGPDKIIISFGS
jgi:hypothetical protein